MKKNLLLVTLVAFIASLVSCGESKIEKMVDSLNNECPISMGVIGEITDVEYENGNVVFNCSVNETLVNIDALNENPDLMKRNIKTVFNNPNGETKELIDMLIEENSGIVYRYTGKESGKVTSITLSSADITDINNNSTEEYNPETALEDQVETANAQCPIIIADGMTTTHIAIEGDYVVYNVDVDESMYSIKTLDSNKAQVKKNMIQEFNGNSDPTIKLFINFCKEANKGVAYKYIGNSSGKICMIKISYSEL